jgi:hypothetical protein
MLHKGIGWSPMRTATWERDRRPIREAIAALSRPCPACQGQRMVHERFGDSGHLLPIVCPTCGGTGRA